MSKSRSPRYPAIGLPDAIEKIRPVYERDYQNKIQKKVVAEHMGYQSLNGKSLAVISAVIKYGLLDGRADSMWVSDRALAIICNEKGHSDRVEAIRAAASEPDLFAEIDTQFSETPSDAALRSYLLTRRKFLPDAADKFIRSYRETREMLDGEVRAYTSDPKPPVVSLDARPQQLGAANLSGTIRGTSSVVATLSDANRPPLKIVIEGPIAHISATVTKPEIEKLKSRLDSLFNLLEDSDVEGEKDSTPS